MVGYMCDQKPPKFCKLGNILRIVEQPYPLPAKACKNQNLQMRQIPICKF